MQEFQFQLRIVITVIKTKILNICFKRYYIERSPETSTELFACGKAAGDWMFEEKLIGFFRIQLQRKSIFMKKKGKKNKKELDLEKNIVIGHIGRFNRRRIINF